MADKNYQSELSHLTSLDFDISAIPKQLEKIQADLEQTAREIATGEQYKLKVDLGGADTQNKINQGIESQISALQKLTGQYQNVSKAKTRIFTDVDQKNVSDYSAKVKDLETSFKATGNGANNFLKTITDKARWLTAFYLINGLKDAFFGSIKTIKETEDAVVELQRVLNEDVAQTEISDQLYKIAQNYGRSFTEVSETAVKFAQTGKSWNETLKATEATMLAVNTAELEVNTATTGLIAVMSQFNLQADEMQSLIDKINITADNFAVTSEKIVAALQRAGSSAVNANLSLEDTIALITTLSEATGRSGENIGTALNSLLIYTSKTKSLDMFAGINEDMDRLVAKYKSGTASIIDVWQGLSTTIQTLSLEQQQNLEKSLLSDEDFSNFTNAFEQEATGVAQTIKDTYSTAGTFRQNYFIALLNNLDTYTEAMGTMAQAEGYSLSENEKAMSTLTRQWQILVETAKQLAVQFGEGGFLNDVKGLLSLATATLKVTQNLGGLKTVLIVLIGLLAKLKQEKISQIWSNTSSAIANARTAVKAYSKSLQGMTIAQKSAKIATDAWNLSLNALMSPAGIFGLLTAISAINGLIDTHNKKIKETIENSVNASSAITEQTQSVISLVNEYERYNALPEEQQSKEKLLELQNKITEATKETYDVENNTSKSLKEQIEDRNILLLKEQTSQENMNKLEIAAQQAANEISRALDPPFFSPSAQKEYGVFQEDLANLQTVLMATGRDFGEVNKLTSGFLNAKDFEEKRKALVEIETAIKNIPESIIKTQAIDFIDNLLEKYRKITEESNIAQENFAKGSLNKYFADVTQSTILTSEQLEEYIKLQNANTNLSNEQRSANIEYARSYYELQNAISNTAVVTQNYIFDLEKLKEVSKGLNEQIDDTQSSFDTLFGIMEEYNSTGTLTADMLKKILSLEGEYSSLLNITADGISLNENATNNLINSKQDLLQKTLAVNTAIQLETLAESLLKEQQEENSKSAGGAIEANDDLATSIYKVLNSATDGAVAMREFASAVKEYGTGIGLEGDFLAKYEEQSKKILSNSRQLSKQIGEVGKTQSFWQSKTSNASKKANDEAKKALQEQKNLVKEKYDTEISKIKEAQEANKKKYNAQIDKLKKVEKENDRIRKKEEFERNRQASLKDLAQAEARSGVEYHEQEFDIQEKINDENRKWQEQLEDWELEDRISKLEKLRDAENERLAEQIKSLEKLRDTETKALEEQIKALEGTLAQTAVTSSTQMATAYKDNFIEPVKEETEKVFTNSYDTLLESNTEFAKKVKEIYSINLFEPLKTEFATVFGTDFTDLAEINSKQMYKIYSENFTTKFKKDIKSIFESTLTASNYVLQNNRNQVTYGYQPQGLSTTNYNSNRSMNVVANVNSASGANKLSNDLNRIFNNSTLPY